MALHNSRTLPTQRPKQPGWSGRTRVSGRRETLSGGEKVRRRFCACVIMPLWVTFEDPDGKSLEKLKLEARERAERNVRRGGVGDVFRVTELVQVETKEEVES